MSYDLTGRSLYPLSELFDLEDLPLGDFLPTDQIESIFEGIYYTESYLHSEDDNTIISARLAILGELSLSLPGTDVFELVLAAGSTGWTSLEVSITIGPDLTFRFVQVPVSLRISETVLRDVSSEQAAEITLEGDIVFTPDGVKIETLSGASLAPAYLADTEVIVEADDVRPIFGPWDPPEWLDDADDFEGLTIDELRVSIPGEYLTLDGGSTLDIVLEQGAIGTTGFSGVVTVQSADLDSPVTGTFLGFPFEFREFSMEIEQNAVIDLSLGLDLRLAMLEDGATEKWVGVDFSFAQSGGISGALSAAQPVGASSSAEYLFEVEFADVVRLGVSSLRVDRDPSDTWACYLSGGMELLIDGASWPEIEFDEIGVNSAGQILLPDGAGITFASPLVVDWHFVGLTINKFRLGYADASDTRLQLGLNADVALIDGVPAGASVEGLTIEWEPGSGDAPDIRFDGIGVEFGVPGSFFGSIAVAYTDADGAVEFRGEGTLALSALDLSIDVGIVIGNDGFNYMYLFADAKLLPSGIPIGSTGLSIYGFQGLLAYNMALDIDTGLSEDERYYELFTRSPIGITDTSKWTKTEGQNALGVGVVLGTADAGFLLNAKGMFVVAFPDLTLLLQARVNFIKLRPELDSSEEGTLDALLVYASGQSTLSLDISASLEVPILYSVDGNARAFFDFDDPAAWYLELGEDEEGKRVTASVLYWGAGWLFNAGYWFRLDNEQLVTGVKIEVGLRAEAGGFWVEASGWAHGEMALYFAPWQWEGSLTLGGRVGAGYKGVSIGIEFEGTARARVFEPFDVYIKVEACIHALFWDICKSFDFEWEKDEPPQLESPVELWSAKPRHWTPKDQSAGDTAELDTGVVTLSTSSTTTIQPHSVVQLDFAKPMVDQTGAFNEAVPLDNGGFVTVGAKSGYSAAFQLDSVRLIRDPDGGAEELSTWGTWSQSTLEPNTSLQLYSSERFTHEGSLTYGWVLRLLLDYCDEAEETIDCFPLDEISPGYGWLDDGSIYHWDTGDEEGPREPGTLEPGDTLVIIHAGSGDGVYVTVDETTGNEDDEDGDQGPPCGAGELKPSDPWPWCKSKSPWVRALKCLCAIPLCVFLTPALLLIGLSALLLFIGLLFDEIPRLLVLLAFLAGLFASLPLLIQWVCDCLCRARWFIRWCRKRFPDEPNELLASSVEPDPPPDPGLAGSDGLAPDPPGSGTPSGTQEADPAPQPIPIDISMGAASGLSTVVVQGANTGGKALHRICYPKGHGRLNWAELSERGGTKTENETWTVPAEMMIFPPGETFEVRIEYTAKLKDKQGTVTEPLGANVEVTSRFTTDGPPKYAGALTSYIADVYPQNGTRPVYTGYDFAVTFVDEYVPYLYASLGEALVIRLRDGQGDVVTDSDGNSLLIPATTVGPTSRTVTEWAWSQVYEHNIAEGCIEGPSDYNDEGLVVLVASPAALDLDLTPNSQYTAELVSDGATDVVLYSWSFSTSAYRTFTELVDEGGVTEPSLTAGSSDTSGDFDSICRSLGVPTIDYVDTFRVTPILSPDGASCIALLIEAPEPLELGTRLSITVNGIDSDLSANLDSTRGFVLPQSGTWDIEEVTLRATWDRDAGDALPLLSVDGDSSSEVVDWTVEVSP